MANSEKVTEQGSRVWLEEHDGHTVVFLDSPRWPGDAQGEPAGRIVQDAFQAAPFSAYAMGPEVLRAVADLIEERSA